ncbi:MAG: response regulator [Pseudomonadota bacterium]
MTEHSSKVERTILLIEDEEVDAEYFSRALKSEIADLKIDTFCDAEGALEHLRDISEDAIRSLPHLVLLDLNLDLTNGFEVLEEIRGDARLMVLPVVVVSTSNSNRDVQKAYRMKVNAFIKKPDDITGYGKIAKAIAAFWFDDIVLIP